MHSFKKTDLTENFLTRWTNDEDNQLITEINHCLSKKESALLHKRTEGSIRCRILKLAHLEFQKGIPIENISIKFNISIHDINKYIAKKNNKLVNNDDQIIIKEKKSNNKLSFDDVCINKLSFTNKLNKCNKQNSNTINVNDDKFLISTLLNSINDSLMVIKQIIK